MNRKGGIKVYRSNKRKHYRKPKTKGQKIASWIAVMLIMAVLVFVGYSICDPVVNFINSWKNRDNLTIDDIMPVESQQSEPAETEQSSVLESETTTAVTEPVSNESFYALEFKAGEILTAKELGSAAQKASKQGCTAAVIELKAAGGAFYYQTYSEIAALSEESIKSTMPAQQLAMTLKSMGITPIARINLLNDNNRYDYPDGTRICSYKFASDNSNWLDNRPTNGGKPWLSPFDTDTQEYIRFLADEIYSAGFELVICDGVIFPPFHNSDLNYIGDIVKSADRYKILINSVDIVKKSADEAGGKTALSVSAKDIINGTAEVFKPDELTADLICVEYYPTDFSGTIVVENSEIDLSTLSEAEKAVTVMNAVRLKSGSLGIIPVLHGSEPSSEMASALKEDGFKTIFFSEN